MVDRGGKTNKNSFSRLIIFIDRNVNVQSIRKVFKISPMGNSENTILGGGIFEVPRKGGFQILRPIRNSLSPKGFVGKNLEI